MRSVRQSKAPYTLNCETRPTAVAVTVHQTATTDFATIKDDYTEQELGMSVRVLHTCGASRSKLFLKDGVYNEGSLTPESSV
jgi:hypothetical protein